MSSLNMVALAGRLAQDAVLRQSDKGTFISTFNVALNRSRKIDDKWEEYPHFFHLNIFGKRAEALSPYLLKGQAVSIQGHLEQDRWESGGVQHSKMAVAVDDIQLIGSAKREARAAAGSDAAKQPAQEVDENIDVPDDGFDPDFDMNFPELESEG